MSSIVIWRYDFLINGVIEPRVSRLLSTEIAATEFINCSLLKRYRSVALARLAGLEFLVISLVRPTLLGSLRLFLRRTHELTFNVLI